MQKCVHVQSAIPAVEQLTHHCSLQTGYYIGFLAFTLLLAIAHALSTLCHMSLVINLLLYICSWHPKHNVSAVYNVQLSISLYYQFYGR